MPTILTHAAVPLAVWAASSGRVSLRLLVAGVAASILPDLDVLGYAFGIPYGDALGHRGASHSLACAIALGALAAVAAGRLKATRPAAFLAVAASALSHGLLDMLTNGGLGVALWWPWSQERHFFPWQVIDVSPIGLRFFSQRGVDVLASELLWVWLPALLLVMLAKRLQRAAASRR